MNSNSTAVPPMVVFAHGQGGTGKSTVAFAIAPLVVLAVKPSLQDLGSTQESLREMPHRGTAGR